MPEPKRPPRPVREVAVAVASRWPTLVAWFLAGWLARMLLLRLAGHLGNIDAVYGLLTLPLAVLARLVSYVAMFMVVRDALVRDPESVADGTAHRRRLAQFRLSGRRFGETVIDAILPFFLIYAAWSIIDQDIVDYARSSLDQINLDSVQPGQGPLTVSLGVLSVSLVVVAFGLRVLLRLVQERVPRWTDAITVYLEAVWVLVTVLVLRTLLAGAPEWIASRRMVAWVLDRLDDLRAWDWVDRLVGGFGPVLGVLSDVVLLPLAWLALAGVVFARADPRQRARVVAARAVRARFAWLPRRWQRVVGWATEGLVERWEPVRRIGTTTWRAGPLRVATYLLAFAVVRAAGSWLDVAFSRLAGPHPREWWIGISGTTSLAIELVVVPLQIAVVAAALAYLSEAARWRHRAPAAAPAAAVADR